jgi:type VI protein secretion system component Hcp
MLNLLWLPATTGNSFRKGTSGRGSYWTAEACKDQILIILTLHITSLKKEQIGLPRFFNLKSLMAAMLSAVMLIFLWPGSSFSASPSLPSILLTLDGIKGSYSVAPYKGAIIVSSYSFGAFGTDSLNGVGEPKFEDIQINKAMDDSSLSILKALARGQTIRSGTLYFQNNNPKNNITYMKIHLTDILVTSYNVSSSESTTESISLHADPMLFEYTTQNPDGSPGKTDQLQIGHQKINTQYHFDPIYGKNSKNISYIKGFRVSLKATAASNSVQQTQYRINGGSWVTYTGSFDIFAADTHSLEYFSTDRAGHVEKTNIMNFDTGTFTGAGSY